MTHKQSITLHKPWPHTDSFGLHLHELATRFRKALKFEIPTGYQDETGFHMGAMPKESEVKWPPVW